MIGLPGAGQLICQPHSSETLLVENILTPPWMTLRTSSPKFLNIGAQSGWDSKQDMKCQQPAAKHLGSMDVGLNRMGSNVDMHR